jgi:hypothetical protein
MEVRPAKDWLMACRGTVILPLGKAIAKYTTTANQSLLNAGDITFADTHDMVIYGFQG